MGIKVSRTRFAARTTTGTQDITASLDGLTPKAALFLYSYATADGTPANGLARFIGATDGSTHAVRRYGDADNLDTTSVGAGADNTIPIILTDPSGNLLAEGAFSAWITNGITISWTVTTGTAILIDVIFFAGSDLSADVSITTLTNAVDTVHDVTSVGFEPDDLIAFVAAGTGMALGFTHSNRASTYTQNSLYQRGRNGQATSQNMAILRSSYGCLVPAGSTSSDASSKLEFGSFDSSGFSVTTRLSAPGSGSTLVVLALRYGTSPVVESTNYIYSTPTATGSNTDANAGFTPQFVMYAASIMEATDTFYTDSLAGSHATITIDASGQCCTAYTSEDNQGTTDTQSLSDDQAVNLPLDSGAAGLAATFTEFTSSGVTLNWSDVEANAKLWLGFAIGTDSAAPQNIDESVVLARNCGIAIGSDSNLLDSILLSNYLTITAEGNKVGGAIEESINLGLILRVTQPMPQNIEESVTLVIHSGISNDSQIIALNEISLNKVNAEGNADIANVIDSTLLGKFENISITTDVNVLDITTLARFDDISSLEIRVISESFILARFAALASEGARPEIEESVTLAKSAGQSSSDLVNIYDFITFTHFISITIREVPTITEVITLLRLVAQTGGTQTNENDVASLVKFSGFAAFEEREGLNEGVSLSYSLGMALLQEGISHVSEDVNVGRLLGIVPNEQGRVSDTISLNRLSSIVSNSQEQVLNAISLNRLTGITSNDQGQLADAISLNRLTSIAASELPLSIIQSISLNRLFGITSNDQGQVSNAISLNRLDNVTTSELPFSIIQNVSLNRLAGISGISLCQVNDNLSLSKLINIIIIDETIGQYSEILTLGRGLSISVFQEGVSHVGETISLNRLNEIAISEQNRIHNSLLFGRTNGIGLNDQYQILSNLIFARSSGLGISTQIAIDDDVTLSKFSVFNTSSQLILNELLSLSKLDNLAILDSRYLLENINLQYNNGLSLIDGSIIFEEIELGRIDIVTLIALLFANNVIGLNQFKSIIAEPQSLYIYDNGDHAVGVLFRDKRAEVLFRDKRAEVLFRDKRVEVLFHDKRASVLWRDKIRK